MKKIKTLLAVGLISMVLASCGDDKAHTHTFSSEWSSSETEHWHAATCEHADQKADVAAHVDNDGDKTCDVCQHAMPASKEKIKNVTGGTVDEQKSIQTCASRSIVQLDGSSSIAIGNITDLYEDDGNYIQLTTSQVITTNKVKYTVKIEWDIAEGENYFEEFSDKGDGTHDLLLIKYPGKGGTEGSLTLRMKKITCGGASSVDTGVDYQFNIKKATLNRADTKISELNKVNEGPITTKNGKTYDAYYDLVDYEIDNPYFKTNNKGVASHEYYYVSAAGKVIYNAPDGNWALIADGDEIMEVYAGSAYDLLPAYYPAMTGKYVKVNGNMSQYNGNVQIGFVSNMLKATVADLTAEPTMNYATIDEALLASIKASYGHKQCVYGENLSNALKQVTGKFVPGSLTLDKDETSLSRGKRFSFKMQVGGEQITIAYDYHTDKDAKWGVGLFEKISALVNDNGAKSFTIKGTLRYNGDDSHCFEPSDEAKGEWQLVPFLGEHVVEVA